MTPFVLLLFFAPPAPDASDIMARVADNQDRAEKARSDYRYHQNVLVRVLRTNGKMSREETSEFAVTPDEHGIKKERTYFLGKYVEHGKEVEYHEPGQAHPHVTVDIDGDVGTSLSDDLVSDKDSKDGIAHDMFPLTAKEQQHYRFKLEGEEDYQGARVYRVTFEPKKGEEDTSWAGEALIDENEYQPVLITTHLAWKIPVVVRTLLGTNVEHVGFKVTYKKFDEGIWFPVTYGGEFKLRALFFYARKIAVSARNSDFEHAQVSSKVTFAPVQ